MTDISALLGLAVAALGGAAIGVERQQSGHALGQNARFAGIRTFTLLGGVSGAAGWLAAAGYTGLSIAVVAGPVALTVVAYLAASRRDVDATTEVAAFVAIVAGLLAGLGLTAIASGIIAVTVLLLVEKSRLHRMVARIDEEELRAAARFAFMAVVVLPLLPEGPYGPLGGVKPRELWLLVLFFTGLDFIGYVARRLVGSERGYTVAGALAGLVSSTNVTYTFARLSRERHVASGTLATGAVAACTVLFPRVLLAAAVLDPGVATSLLPYVGGPFVLGAMVVYFWLRRRKESTHLEPASSSPLHVWPALQMAATFQVVLFGVAIVRGSFGDAGLLVSGAVLGLTDVDALTISMAKTTAAGVPSQVAAQAIAIGIVANSAMKATIAAVLGSREFGRRTGGVLAAMAIVLGVAIAIVG